MNPSSENLNREKNSKSAKNAGELERGGSSFFEKRINSFLGCPYILRGSAHRSYTHVKERGKLKALQEGIRSFTRKDLSLRRGA